MTIEEDKIYQLKLKLYNIQKEIISLKKSYESDSSCCKDICDSLQELFNNVEANIFKIDTKLYNKIEKLNKMRFIFPKGLDKSDVHSFKKTIYKDKEFNKLTKEKEELIQLFKQIKNNNICLCDKYEFTRN